MSKYLKYFWMICKHKWYVGQECFKHGLYYQGIVHDLSKFSPTEFLTSAKFYQGYRSPIFAEREKYGYSYVWIHHTTKNKHHWDHWVELYGGVPHPAPMPDKYIKEIVCDKV